MRPPADTSGDPLDGHAVDHDVLHRTIARARGDATDPLDDIEALPIACEVTQIEGLSAHADWQEILDWLTPIEHAPQRVFVTHGEPVAADILRQKLEHVLGWSAEVPEQDEELNLD